MTVSPTARQLRADLGPAYAEVPIYGKGETDDLCWHSSEPPTLQ